jgi:ABC-type Na+ efflux pump permease subunit
MLVYFFVFFLFFALLLALPDLLEGLRTLPPAASIEEERAAGAEIAQHAVRGKLTAAFLATLLALGLGAYTRVLPGIRKRR